ncbi:hypothetical protein BDB01DRAFT_319454 [Pilobolus umbonatus]|nr:hypothetical protein BDB01DRAFT_319454 [Pilobolus umbonatus]
MNSPQLLPIDVTIVTHYSRDLYPSNNTPLIKHPIHNTITSEHKDMKVLLEIERCRIIYLYS